MMIYIITFCKMYLCVKPSSTIRNQFLFKDPVRTAQETLAISVIRTSHCIRLFWDTHRKAHKYIVWTECRILLQKVT